MSIEKAFKEIERSILGRGLHPLTVREAKWKVWDKIDACIEADAERDLNPHEAEQYLERMGYRPREDD